MIPASELYPHNIPSERLNEAVLELLDKGSYTSAELAAKVGYAITTVRGRLIQLDSRGKVCRSSFTGPTGIGATFVWHAGATVPAGLNVSTYEPPIPGEVPRRIITRNYPTVGRCDPLVAAFFGHLEAA